MNLNEKISYNKRQAKKNGWEPNWFGCDDFNQYLIVKIKEFQEENGLVSDGLAGPSTYRCINTLRESLDMSEEEPVDLSDINVIIHNEQPFRIYWNKVSLWHEGKALKCKTGTFTPKSSRKPTKFVTHWDVCLSSSSCAKVLNKRGLSVHFLIDNDGTIHQCLDMKEIAWHAGRTQNALSVGVEISNAYSLKYQAHYKKRYGERPIWDNAKVHGKSLKPFLGFYDVQIKALAALWEAVSYACGIPLVSPSEESYSKEASGKDYSGFVCHFHLTARKIDCAGLNRELVLLLAQEYRSIRNNEG